MQWCQCLIESPILLKSTAPIFMESVVYGSRLIFPPVASDNCVTMSLTAAAGFPRHLFPRDQRMNICDNILRSCIFLHGNKKTKDMRSIEFSSLNVLMRDSNKNLNCKTGSVSDGWFWQLSKPFSRFSIGSRSALTLEEPQNSKLEFFIFRFLPLSQKVTCEYWQLRPHPFLQKEQPSLEWYTLKFQL